MTALMGSSGAGKTTLMDCLAGRKTTGLITGSILVNGLPVDFRTFSRTAAYCEQMDLHTEQQTVREAVEFSAALRLDSSVTPIQRRQLVEDTLIQLDMMSLQDRIVGKAGSGGLSNEQRKRLTIAVELVSNPSILFLDEPTTGLDSRVAMTIMRSLRELAARRNICVVVTIHQPSSEIFGLFEHLLLLKRGGKIVYHGPIGEHAATLLDYFERASGKVAPDDVNPATYMLALIGAGVKAAREPTASDAEPEKELEYDRIYLDSKECADNKAKVDAVIERGTRNEAAGKLVKNTTSKCATYWESPMVTPLHTQMYYTIVKTARIYYRTIEYTAMRVVMFPLFALVFGSAFYKLGWLTIPKVRSQYALMYQVLDFMGVFNMMTVQDIASSERAVFYRERASRLYGELPYQISFFFAEIPYNIITTVTFVAIEYFLVGLDPAFFGRTWVVFFLYGSICTYMGHLAGALMPNQKAATVLVGGISCIFNLYAGFICPIPSMGEWAHIISFAIPTRYALENTLVFQTGDCNDPTSPLCPTIIGPDGKIWTLEAFARYRWSWEYSHIQRNFGVLILFVTIGQVLWFLTLRFVSHLNR
eukprot:gb/GEZN01002973.1/.p1 GENE.gb/GEZN01002973.1/~~gb/GEZN01002973.1/.p1  ORF type:complete len:694 (-),score=47.81 gb/GEZN01002973.1/:229-1998(-)